MITLGISDVRAMLPKLIDTIDAQFERLTITKGGKPKAVIMSSEEFEGWIETIASLNDPETMKIHREIKAAKSPKELKHTLTLEELKRRLGDA